MKENFGCKPNPAWVLLPNGLNGSSPIKQKGLSMSRVSLNLNCFNIPDHPKWDLMSIKIKHLHLIGGGCHSMCASAAKKGEEEGKQGSCCMDKMERIIHN